MTNLNQNGRSMIEMLGVLAIIGVLSVGGIAGYSKAMMKFRINKTIDQIAMTVTNIRTLYAQQSSYTGLSHTNAYAMGVSDDAMGTSGALENPFDGNYYIGTSDSLEVGTTNGAFIITATGLPREACVSIATNDWGSGYSSGLLGIATGKGDVTEIQNIADCGVNGLKTGGTAPTNGACSVGNVSAALAVSAAATGCSCGTDNNCWVSFKYY